MTARKRVACLHTAASNIPLFDAAAADLALDLRHLVRADLLADAEQAGGLTPSIVEATEAALRVAAGDADFVLLACSTLGPIADGLRTKVPTLRIDRALAEAAVKTGGRVAVLYTFPGTAQASGDLFREVAAGTEAKIDLQLVAGAWDRFKAGDQQRYFAMIADAADRAFAEGAASVAFAQASMAPAAGLCVKGTPLTSPRASLLKAVGGRPD
ncbi:MAG: Asp/Glu racemase [Rhodospirillaceae bacterium]|nr:Asp/Glu racemase [Rhodospirillaceae bacterium]